MSIEDQCLVLAAKRVAFDLHRLRHQSRISLLVEASVEFKSATPRGDSGLDVATRVLLSVIRDLFLGLASDLVEKLLA